MGFFLYAAIHWKTRVDRDGVKRNPCYLVRHIETFIKKLPNYLGIETINDLLLHKIIIFKQ